MSMPPIPFADPRAMETLLRAVPMPALDFYDSLAEAMYRFAVAERYRAANPEEFTADDAAAVALHPDGTVIMTRAAARRLSDLYAGDGDEMIVDRPYLRARLIDGGIAESEVDAVIETFKRPAADTVDLTAARIARQHNTDPDAA